MLPPHYVISIDECPSSFFMSFALSGSTLVFTSVSDVMDKLDQISKRVSLVASGTDTRDFVINFHIEKGSCPKGSVEKVNSDDKIIACENVAEGDKVPINVIIKQKEGVELSGPKEFYLNLPGNHAVNDSVDYINSKGSHKRLLCFFKMLAICY